MLNALLRNIVHLVRHRSTGNHKSIFFPQHEFSTSAQRFTQLPQLSPYDVNLILKENEFMYTIPEEEGSCIHSYESNQLAANKPCEDTHTEASFLHQNAFVCGIFDGHGGPACSQVISKRLLRYLAASVTQREKLQDLMTQGSCNSQVFLKCYNDQVDFVKEIKDIYENSFTEFIQRISAREQTNSLVNGTNRDSNYLQEQQQQQQPEPQIHSQMDRVQEIQTAFLHLDNDLSNEALEHSNIRTMAVAMSGAVACVTYIEGLDVYVASTGDCSAVLGSQCPQSGKWTSKKLSIEHNIDNHSEVKRILAEHPGGERDTVIRNDRLLGQLAPLRALGDFRYKWPNKIMEDFVIPSYGPSAVPPNYHTPPYLTAEPEVEHHRLTINDKFLVIGSDGLWDFLTPSQVVSLVAEHLTSKQVLHPLKIPADNATLQEISDILQERKAGRARKPLDQNSATHLIRYALGATDYGIEHSKISYYLSLPQDVVRFYRDDITITVIYFNSQRIEALSQ